MFETNLHQASVDEQKETSAISTTKYPELVTGVVERIDHGKPVVKFVHKKVYRVGALSTFSVSYELVGREVAILFLNGNPETPVIIGVMRNFLEQAIENFELTVDETNNPQGVMDAEVEISGKTIKLSADDNLELRCGESSISLSNDGKVSIRGKYLISRSSGVNRILGGSVQVN